MSYRIQHTLTVKACCGKVFVGSYVVTCAVHVDRMIGGFGDVSVRGVW